MNKTPTDIDRTWYVLSVGSTSVSTQLDLRLIRAIFMWRCMLQCVCSLWQSSVDSALTRLTPTWQTQVNEQSTSWLPSFFKRLCIFGPKGAIQIRYYYFKINFPYHFTTAALKTLNPIPVACVTSVTGCHVMGAKFASKDKGGHIYRSSAGFDRKLSSRLKTMQWKKVVFYGIYVFLNTFLYAVCECMKIVNLFIMNYDCQHLPFYTPRLFTLLSLLS